MQTTYIHIQRSQTDSIRQCLILVNQLVKITTSSHLQKLALSLGTPHVDT